MSSATLVGSASTTTALVDAKSMAAILNLHPETVAQWARRKKIPSHRLSRKAIRFRPADVLAALGIAS